MITQDGKIRQISHMNIYIFGVIESNRCFITYHPAQLAEKKEKIVAKKKNLDPTKKGKKSKLNQFKNVKKLIFAYMHSH